MDYRSCPNLAHMFFQEAARQGDKPFLWAKKDGVYRSMSWREAAAEVSALSRGLRTFGLKPGDRIGLVSENRPEWMLADLAIMASGAITVPAYVTNTVEDHRHVLSSSGAKVVIVSTSALAERVIPAADQVESITHVVTIEEPRKGQLSRAEHFTWEKLQKYGLTFHDDAAEMAARAKRDDIACLIYTSGTGGVPKGVMLTHGNILANCLGAYKLLETIGLGDEVFLCFLPLSHSYEHTAGMMFPISLGAQIYFAEGADTLAANMVEVKPTIMTAVPRLYEALHQRILKGVERQGGVKAKLFHRAVTVGSKRWTEGLKPSLLDLTYDWLLDILVRKKVAERFGGRLKAMVSGGAPLNPEIGRFFLSLGIRLLQGYGQTETSPVISANPPTRIRIETVGPPVEGVEVKIAEDGEILVRGELVMKGYWNDPEATARTVMDGWLHTGDIGVIDPDGYIRITDRKKDFIKNSGGDMVSPAKIEGQLTMQPEILQAMVFGDRRPFLVAVIVPDAEHLKGKDEAAIRTEIQAAMRRANGDLAPIERVRHFILATEPFSTANGQMTPTLKIKRFAIREVYGDALTALYEK